MTSSQSAQPVDSSDSSVLSPSGRSPARNYRRLWWRRYLLLLAIAALPLLMLCLVLQLLFTRIYTERATATLLAESATLSNAVNQVFSGHAEQLYHALQHCQLTEPSPENCLSDLLARLRATSESYLALELLDLNGQRIASATSRTPSPSPPNDSAATLAWLEAARKNGIAWDDVVTGRDAQPVCRVAIHAENEKKPWFLVATIDLHPVARLLHAAWAGQPNNAFLIDHKYKVQVGSCCGTSSPAVPDRNPDTLALGKPTVQRGIIDDQDTLCALAPIDNPEWILLIKQEARAMLAPLYRLNLWLLGLTAAALGCILVGMGLYSSAAVKRHRALDQENDAHADMLLQANKMVALSKMAASVAHEVNNPLASIAERAGWMQDLLHETDLEASPNAVEFQDSVNKIERHVERARKIVQNLLGLTRRMDTDRQTININCLLDETTGFLENEARYANIRIQKEYAAELPEIISDLSQIQQIVLNLLNNAIDAIGRDGVITVSSLFHPPAQVEIKIADTGPGIPENELKKIFEPFYTTKAPGKGTGLGLSISRSILEKLGGRLTVHSKPGAGTVFSVHLPKQQQGLIDHGHTASTDR